MIRFGEDLVQEKESHTSGFSLLIKHEKDTIKEETMDQYCEITGDDQDCQHVMEENQSSPSSSGSESVISDSDLLVDNLESWDFYDQFDFGLR